MMVLGCILCTQPLVTRIQPGKPKPKTKLKKAQISAVAPSPGASSSSYPPRYPFQQYQPSAIALGPSRATAAVTGSRVCPCPPPLHNDFEVIAAKCGHMFHRLCLKTYISSRIKLSIGNKAPCPFCDKYIMLAQCVPVQLLVPDSHLILDQLSALLQQNNRLQERVQHARTAVKAEKMHEVATLQKKVKEREMELQEKYLALKRGRGDEEFRKLKREYDLVQEQNDYLQTQNRELIELIEDAAKIQKELGPVNSHCQECVSQV